MSPYPSLDRPVSLQSWGHQLKVDSVDDARIDQFIRALRQNEYNHPEVGGTCDADPQTFSIDSPPPFVGTPPGPDAMPMDYNPSPEQPASGMPTSGEIPGQPTGQPAPTSG
jgi:Protein of unknown function (DUF3105)